MEEMPWPLSWKGKSGHIFSELKSCEVGGSGPHLEAWALHSGVRRDPGKKEVEEPPSTGAI